MDKPNLSAELINHIEGEILPRYEAFDKAHDRRHAFMVMSNSLRLAQHYDVDMQMVYTIAAYHDLGLEAGREQHHTVSARIVREEKKLKKFFTSEQIEIMADAVEDHRASCSKPPRTIYGKIVAEADRIIDSTTIMTRTIQYGLSHYPTLTALGHIERAVAHIKEKYSEGGYLKLWIPESENAARLDDFRALIKNGTELREHLQSIYNKEKEIEGHA
ncbi:MAG: HD domain-containing protein [Bacteroidaceae bacterium]|nr:HD domain-containing protein [Bacteroidaceae bacterium]